MLGHLKFSRLIQEASMNTHTKMKKIGLGLKRIGVFAAVFLSCLLASVLLWRRTEPVHGQARASLWVRSSSFSGGGAIPSDHTCDGADLSPPLQWQSAPAGTKSFAIVVDDPDTPTDFTHWLVYNIAPGVRELLQNASTHAASHQGAAEGRNDFGHSGYEGPCPPPGKPHRYVFRVYALDRFLDLPPGATRKQLDAAIVGHIVSQGQIIGIYRRMNK
jgi:Raf kinase inhibitor-like YbhB/YbcL family protein